jgi:hypothetical protein
MLTNKEVYTIVKKTCYYRDNVASFWHVQRMEENRISKKVLYVLSIDYSELCILDLLQSK